MTVKEYLGQAYLLDNRIKVINHHFKWWFNISPPKGYYYCSPRRAVSQALLLAPL